MNQLEQEILHHHAAAIDWLCKALANDGDPERFRTAAFAAALQQWKTQPPEEMAEVLSRNLTALYKAMGRGDGNG